MKPSSVTELLFDQLNFRADRQRVISNNIANVNTPEYKTKDISFSQELKKDSSSIELAVTNPKHIRSSGSTIAPQKPEVYDVKGLEVQNDGNNVNLDSQMSEMAKNNMMFNALKEAIKKDSRLFRSVLEASNKN